MSKGVFDWLLPVAGIAAPFALGALGPAAAAAAPSTAAASAAAGGTGMGALAGLSSATPQFLGSAAANAGSLAGLGGAAALGPAGYAGVGPGVMGGNPFSSMDLMGMLKEKGPKMAMDMYGKHQQAEQEQMAMAEQQRQAMLASMPNMRRPVGQSNLSALSPYQGTGRFSITPYGRV